MKKKPMISLTILIVLSLLVGSSWGQQDSKIRCSQILPHTGIPIGARNLSFYHGVNSRDALNKFIASGADYAEGDVSIGSNGSLIMAHPPQKSSDLSFMNWLRILTNTNRSIKIDFKDPLAIDTAIENLLFYGLHQQQPKDSVRLILHADIIRGPLGHVPIFSTQDLKKIRKYFPHAIISLGVTLTKDSPVIGSEILSQLKSEASKIGGPITFSILATHTTPEIINFLYNIQFDRNITFWDHPAHKVSLQLYEYLIHKAPDAFFDLRDNPLFSPPPSPDL